MSKNSLSEVEPWELVSDGYVSEIVPVFEKWAKYSLERIKPKKDDRVIDIATGPGTVALLLADYVEKVDALDFSPKMISYLKKEIDCRRIKNIIPKIHDCQALPFKNECFDLAFSQFGLMFFPDRKRGFNEAYRVLKKGGKAAIYSWAPVSESPAMQMMLGALHAGFPETRPSKSDSQTVISGLDDLKVFRREMEGAGFKGIEFEEVVYSFPVPKKADKFWENMVKGSAPITLMKSKVTQTVWDENEKRSIQYLEDHLESSELSSKAYLATGIK